MNSNEPALWRDALPHPAADGHKYDRGHALVVSGGVASTGAARLAAGAALRIGAGLVTVASPSSALLVNAAQLTAVMVRAVDGAAGVATLLEDERFNAVVAGPGMGHGGMGHGGTRDTATRDTVLAILHSGAAAVLDADALTAFAGEPDALFAAIRGRNAATVLTPHDGEFGRLFAIHGPHAEGAQKAAGRSGAVVVRKGPRTAVAAPHGRAVVNRHASPYLATAGAGDVLAGMVGGLLAQGMDAFEAAAAAVWMHGDAARRFGPGLVAEDLEGLLPAVLRDLPG